MNGKSRVPVLRLPGRSRTFALGVSILAATVYINLASEHPAEALKAFFLSTLSNSTVFLNLLEQAAAPAVCALGAALVFRSGDFNLGGEGQAYAGSVLSVLALLSASRLPGSAGLAVGLLSGAFAGALVSFPSALSRRKTGADALLSTFLVSQAVLLALDWAVAGPLRDPASNLMATRVIERAFRLPRLFPPSTISPALILAAAFAAGMDRFLRMSRRGMELTMYGKNPEFARSIGFRVADCAFWPLVASGALHGIAGALLALGGNGRAVRGMTGGIGWNGISIALVAANDPRWVLPAALFFSWLDAGSRQASILADLPVDVGVVSKALVLLLATARFLGGAEKRGRP